MGVEIMGGDLDTLSEHTGMAAVANLFSLVANSKSPCTHEAGLPQPIIRFNPFYTLFALFGPILASIFSL